MDNFQALSFVACPNPDHVNQEGWESKQLYYAGNGTFKCRSCGKEFTREDIWNEMQKDRAHQFQYLQRDYQQNLARLHKDWQDTLDKFNEIDERNVYTA